MNARTAKLINKYAGNTDIKAKIIKRFWNTLPWKEKYEQRQKMVSALNE